MESEVKRKFSENLFTLKSLTYGFFIFLSFTITICSSIGFTTKTNLITSLLLISILFFIFSIYIIITLHSYYVLPRCPKNKIGILIIINTNNDKYYSILKDKLIYNFNELVINNNFNKFHCVVLNTKHISKLKQNLDKNYQEKLVTKTNCVLCLIIKPTENGENNDYYTLELKAGTKIPNMSQQLLLTLNQSFSISFKDLKNQEFDKTNDIKSLKSFSKQLFYFCRYVFASTVYFSLDFNASYNLFKELFNEVKDFKYNISIYNTIKYIGGIWLLELCHIQTTIEYKKFIQNKIYNFEYVNSILQQEEICFQREKLSGIPQFIINYHTAKAINLFLSSRNVEDALKEIDILDNLFPSTINGSQWDYSKAFLISYSTKDFWKIKKQYEKLKNNYTVNIFDIINFIDNILSTEDNIGLHVARLYIYYTREDIHDKTVFDELKKELLKKLSKETSPDFISHIKKLTVKKKG